ELFPRRHPCSFLESEHVRRRRRRVRTLHFLCSLLRPDGPRGEAAALVRDHRVKWAPVLLLATEHRLTSALWAALRDAHLMSPVPAAVRAFMDQREPDKRHITVVLQDTYDETLRRNTDLLGQ